MKKTILILFIFLIGCITRPLTLTTKEDTLIACCGGTEIGNVEGRLDDTIPIYVEVFIAEQCDNDSCLGLSWHPEDSSFYIFGDTMEVIKMLWYLDMKNRKEIDSLQQKPNCIIK